MLSVLSAFFVSFVVKNAKKQQRVPIEGLVHLVPSFVPFVVKRGKYLYY